MTIDPSATETLDLAALAPAVRNAGFKPGDMWIRGTGTLEREQDRARFRLHGWPTTLPWEGAPLTWDAATPLVARVEHASRPPTLVTDRPAPDFTRHETP